MYSVFFTSKAEKDLEKIAKKDVKNTLQKVSKLTYPFPNNLDIKPISGVNSFFRLRSGRIRALFEADKTKNEIWIRKVGYRGGIYKF
ncbi:hypothetical protein A3D84_03595 [Candidatus Woesebacteria bacterium RIFCSPHIGHO2_02_FULL_42_20]|uniref:Plasmid stabilization protein n=1 Tax=Candidatus Woesebacteria bacterium RIFCSPHIGHO2_12_FULL_41_24 TaxID=1802510 RepID=A0A1F8AVE4_9BACT|nr:MAG: hypothetical protein A2W15_03745 [Candidatus Woesebacteria bacterium RBG_16_41_13]OGM28561.1 MAG: hypothetical protein A2873_02875 [Candidatus Woesebacteria bacterium RIFCSPHIGHO2_01_FULL_42_80]OGM35617.1 MAG: hypothetical protein A3D84_03595 [Candidatus Woesebacteria bacterium RIFCSPHIGHO2_02_FULL_42_20]OGM55228.1 MAG: hypothetical protein A3E44_03005 [Candidatus Woesebacteria bacterium RIFCSPHIGHO2_12_FULL_41_24]OGM67182.1 MAG: hypothetical protein A2969_04730 [Candidatus Woesebacteri